MEIRFPSDARRSGVSDKTGFALFSARGAMKPTFQQGYFLLSLISLLSVCPALATPVASDGPLCGASGIVFVVDGAGGDENATRSIAAATDQFLPPVHVRSFHWSHGQCRGLADVVDVAYARCQGRLLAEEVCRYRSAYPGIPIYLVAYSAGSYVMLAACEQLPPDCLERIILLAPSVSAGYDLRPALASARQGVDAFTSERDRFYLGLGTTVIGTSDRKHEAAAGRVGFCPPVLSPCEAWLAGRLRQHAWNPGVAWTGNDGGHSGSLQREYLKAYVLPLLTPVDPTVPK
jgi:pimeloyl-ACP methyl ester carboxylesterase